MAQTAPRKLSEQLIHPAHSEHSHITPRKQCCTPGHKHCAPGCIGGCSRLLRCDPHVTATKRIQFTCWAPRQRAPRCTTCCGRGPRAGRDGLPGAEARRRSAGEDQEGRAQPHHPGAAGRHGRSVSSNATGNWSINTHATTQTHISHITNTHITTQTSCWRFSPLAIPLVPSVFVGSVLSGLREYQRVLLCAASAWR